MAMSTFPSTSMFPVTWTWTLMRTYKWTWMWRGTGADATRIRTCTHTQSKTLRFSDLSLISYKAGAWKVLAYASALSVAKSTSAFKFSALSFFRALLTGGITLPSIDDRHCIRKHILAKIARTFLPFWSQQICKFCFGLVCVNCSISIICKIYNLMQTRESALNCWLYCAISNSAAPGQNLLRKGRLFLVLSVPN